MTVKKEQVLVIFGFVNRTNIGTIHVNITNTVTFGFLNNTNIGNFCRYIFKEIKKIKRNKDIKRNKKDKNNRNFPSFPIFHPMNIGVQLPKIVCCFLHIDMLV